MAVEKFGKTWWGERWLASLTNIDYSNRLPRGATYARNGRVSELEITNGEIIAYVDGSRPRPYKVTLWMDKFKSKDMKKLVQKIMNYPTIVSKLLNGKMDPLLNDLLEEMGLKLFPKESDDMGMECSCPDWAVPCKHIAATIYKVCKDIDNNPFVLFEFRDTDLIKLLHKININVNAFQDKTIENQKDFIKKNKLSILNEIIYSESIDFSKLDNRFEEFLHLLESNPPFYPYGDFKLEYKKKLKRFGVMSSKVLSYQQTLYSLFKDVESNDFVPDLEVVCTFSNNKLNISPISWSELWELTPTALELSHPSYRHYNEQLKLAFHCINKGLITPKILGNKEKYSIMWLPAILDLKLAKTIKEINPKYGIFLDKKQKQRANQFLSLGLIITEIIQRFNEYYFDEDNNIDNIFFKKHLSSFSEMSETSFPVSIARWLQLFEFDLGDYFPVLEINELAGNDFSVDINIAHKQKALSKPKTLSKFIAKTKNQTQLFDLYKDLDLLSNHIEGVDSYINSKGKQAIQYNKETFADFLFNICPIMTLLGIKVVLPKSLNKLIKPKPTVRVSSNGSTSSGLLGLSKLLNFNWKMSVGDELISYSDFLKLIHAAAGLTKFKGKYIYVSEAELRKLNKHFQKPPMLTNMDILRVTLAGDVNGAPIELSKEAKALIEELTKYDLIEPPTKLKATLRPYQHRGFSWMVKNARIGVGSIIGDDMGLGKTLQVITLLGYMIENQFLGEMKVLIIVPTSLIPNWENEFDKFMPDLKVFTYYGPKRSIKKLEKHQIILTSYGNARSDQDKLKKIKWAISIIDESQNIKNPTAQQTIAIKSFKANHNIAMSGTPVENRLMDYWSIMDYTNKGLLGNKTNFRKSFEIPIAQEHNKEVLQRFLNITSPFLLRRMKTDKSVISDLPEKIIQDTIAILKPAQAALYQKVVDEALNIIEQEDTEVKGGLFKRSGLVLQMILSLKQICNHPAQWLKDGHIKPELSGKMTLLIDTIRSIIDAGEKVLIFTQFRKMGDIIEANLLQELGLQSLWLHGGTSLKKRKKMVEDFQTFSHKKVMILSLKAGGTGLNLTAANHVIHYDLWWNPAVEAQATDRAFRIGQTKNVMVHRFITKNTFEEKINDLINSKKELANMSVGTGEKWIGELNNKELGEMFKIK